MKTKIIALAVMMSALFSVPSFAHEGHDHQSDEAADISQNPEVKPAEKAHDCEGAAIDDDESTD